MHRPMAASWVAVVFFVVVHLTRALPSDASEAPSTGLRGAGSVPPSARLLQQDSGDGCNQGGPGVAEGSIRFANTSIVIKAPASTIWGFLTRMQYWGMWNDVFSVEMEGAPEVGKHFKISSYFATAPWGLRKTKLTFNLTELEKEKQICWEDAGLPGLQARHCFTFCKVEEGTLLYNYEDHSGVFKRPVRGVMGQATTDGFNRFNDALRNQSESAATAQLAKPAPPQ